MKFADSHYRKVLVPDIDRVTDPIGQLTGHFQWAREEFLRMPESLSRFSYAEGKWTTAQILGHLVDTQIIWLYRILWIARGEKRPLLYADENLWTANSGYESISLQEISGRYAKISASTQSILLTLPDESYRQSGEVNGIEMTAMEGMMTLIAHEIHHLRIIRERHEG
jgi:uncharacterized damage-inducible protein DinB